MRNVATIALREAQSHFLTPTAYAAVSGFMVLSGFFFFSLLERFNGALQRAALMADVHPNLNEWVIAPYYLTLEIILVFLIPILAVRTVTEDKRSGMFELLFTSPLHVSDIVLGKFIGLALIVMLMICSSALFPLILIRYADPEAAPILVGLLGMMLFGLGMAALALGISSFCRSGTVAGIAGLVVCLVFYLLDVPLRHFGSSGSAALHRLVRLLAYIAPSSHTELLRQGVIDGVDIVYFVSLIIGGLFLANRVLDAQRWR